MNIQHEILSFYPATGSLLVRYFCDELPEGLAYNIDVPLENGAFVGQDEIDELIKAMQPTGQLERLAALKSVVVPDCLAVHIPTVEEGNA